MTDFDFIPSHYHEAASRRRVRHTQSLWGVALAAAMAAWLWSHRVQMAAAQDELNQVREQWGQLEMQRRTFTDLMQRRQQLMSVDAVLRRIDDRASLTVTLAELGALLPDGNVLTKLVYGSRPVTVMDDAGTAGRSNDPTRRVAQPAAPGTPGTGTAPIPVSRIATTLRLVGAAQSNNYYSAFAARLGGSSLFRDVHTSAVKEATFAGRKVLQFEIECDVLPQEGGPR